MRYIDIHSHINFAEFENDREAVIKKLEENGIGYITVGTDLDTSRGALEFVSRQDYSSYATVGIHPTHSLNANGSIRADKDFEELEKLAVSKHVVAIGECGLDYYRLSEETAKIQKEAFIKQIQIANKLKKPLMLHIRNAYSDAFDILKNYATVKGNVHFFVGTWDEAKKFLNFGFTLSFTGVVTFARDYDEVVKNVPLDMIMSETDAPYVSPHPKRGTRNEPCNVECIVKKIAEIRGEDEENIRQHIMQNANRVFNLGL